MFLQTIRRIFFLYSNMFSFIPIYLLAFVLFTRTYAFDAKTMNTSLWLSSAAYCGKDNYETMVLTEYAKGFVVKGVIYDKPTNLQGFIGILPSANTIYVAFRGSSSIKNWIDDAEVLKVDYKTYPECNSKVHDGFYKSCENVKDYVVNTIIPLNKQYKNPVILTGHSYGAAISQLVAMELQRHDIQTIVYNFGQPKVGNAELADCVNTIMGDKLHRVVHDRDMVPHLPEVGYYHSCGEIFEDKSGDLRTCICNDPTCSDQYNIFETSTKDHSLYLGYTFDCSTSTA